MITSDNQPNNEGGETYMPYPTAHKMRQAGFGLRLAAYLLNVIIFALTVILLFLLWIVIAKLLGTDWEKLKDSVLMAGVVLYFIGLPILRIIIPSFFDCSRFQGTPGKMILGIKVVDDFGNRVSFLKALGRQAGKILSWLTFFIGYLMPIWTRHKQALHDILANTYVVIKEDELY